MIHSCLLRNCLDSIIEILNLGVGHVRRVIEGVATSGYKLLVRSPHVVEGYP